MTYPRPADERLLPMTFDETRRTATFSLGDGHARFDGAMYGGTGIAAAVIAMEAATQRDALWVTIQFVAPPQSGDVIECAVDTLAMGRRIAQVQVTGCVRGDVMFVALGSTAVARDGGLTGQYLRMPAVSRPEDSPARERWGGAEMHAQSYVSRVEFREAGRLDDAPIAGDLLLWARLVDEPALTPAGIAFVADMVPVAITRAAGKAGAGVSLDNSMRFGPATTETAWVLLELIGDLATGGYGHGSLRAWATDGTLVAVGSQTANMIYVADSDAEVFASRGFLTPGS